MDGLKSTSKATLWGISTQHRLVVLDENISNAMSQIGGQLSSRFDALTALLDLTKGYARYEGETLIKTIKSRGSVITAKSTLDDVLRQKGAIFDLPPQNKPKGFRYF